MMRAVLQVSKNVARPIKVKVCTSMAKGTKAPKSAVSSEYHTTPKLDERSL